MIRMRSVGFATMTLAATAAMVAASPRAGSGQEPEPLAVGTVAPDFALPGATRYGILQDPVTLSDYEGKTVVLAFFFKARTKG